MDALQVSWNALQSLIVLHSILLKEGNKPRYQEVTEQKQNYSESQNLTSLELLETIPSVLYNSPINPSRMNWINPARSWKPLARFEEHTGMELSQRMANLNPQLSNRKRRTIDILLLEPKASRATIFIQTNSVQTRCCVVRNPDSTFFSIPTMGKKCRQWNTVGLEILLLSDLIPLIINFQKGKR